MNKHPGGFAAIFILLLGVVILVFIAVTFYTDLLKNNPALDYLTSPESKNLAAPPSTEDIPTTSTSPPDSTDSKGLRCETNEDCTSLSYCTDSKPKVCYVGKCLIRTCVTETRVY